jgi:hypothetical protein
MMYAKLRIEEIANKKAGITRLFNFNQANFFVLNEHVATDK